MADGLIKAKVRLILPIFASTDKTCARFSKLAMHKHLLWPDAPTCSFQYTSNARRLKLLPLLLAPNPLKPLQHTSHSPNWFQIWMFCNRSYFYVAIRTMHVVARWNLLFYKTLILAWSRNPNMNCEYQIYVLQISYRWHHESSSWCTDGTKLTLSGHHVFAHISSMVPGPSLLLVLFHHVTSRCLPGPTWRNSVTTCLYPGCDYLEPKWRCTQTVPYVFPACVKLTSGKPDFT